MNNNLQHILKQGEWNLHNHHIKPYRYTDGVHYLTMITNCHWLLDAIFSHQRKEGFQVWELTVDRDNRNGILTMKQDRNEPILVKQEFPECDFPMDYIKLWIMGGTLLLISEYE